MLLLLGFRALPEPFFRSAQAAISGSDFASGKLRNAVRARDAHIRALQRSPPLVRSWSTPEEFEKAIRGTERDASILLEAGFQPVPEPPAPAFQIIDESVDVDMMDSAGHALAGGASAYLAAYVQPERLIDAVKDLFHAFELLLKVRLEASNPLGLRDQPNNPTVLGRLAAIGVALSADETITLIELRRLRNDLQHSSGRATGSTPRRCARPRSGGRPRQPGRRGRPLC